MARRTLGIVQIDILEAIRDNPSEAYGSAITDFISGDRAESIDSGQVSLCLRRLAKHGFVESYRKKEKRTGRGRPRTYYKLTEEGQTVLANRGTYYV